MAQSYSAKLLEIKEEYRKNDSSAKEAEEQRKTKDAVRALKGFSPEEIRKYQQELRQRIELFEKKVELLGKKEKEIETFEADVENRKSEITGYETKAV